MVKLGSIDFHDDILRALRDDSLVVFAGAGVSMGPPSFLPSFEKLANDIADGTGKTASQPLDRFLGQLHHEKVPVHNRAVQLLSRSDSKPTSLHENLIGMFRDVERVRVVTTNFDLHFEAASASHFGKIPDVYRAPALPLGYRFTGIVHVHGALTHSDSLVLTDADFGRAYLTEGWARRFLVDVFRQYTVLFVGYSHDDVVMNYLSRALPADGIAGRYALTEQDGKWKLLGISPVPFKKVGGDDPYFELNDGVKKLAERAKRGVLDWQTRIAELASRTPPADEEAIGEVEQALQELHTTRFFTKVARDEEWPRWLNARKHFTSLFNAAKLSERDNDLAYWLAQHYAIDHPDVVFEVIAANGLQLNPDFWWIVSREIGLNKEKEISESAFKRWITILLATVPHQSDFYVFTWLAEKCEKQGYVDQSFKIFLKMSEYRLSLKPKVRWFDEDEDGNGKHLEVECAFRSDYGDLEDVWSHRLKPHLESIVPSLLSSISLLFNSIYQDLTTWGRANDKWDPISYHRSAIEPHEQDRYPESIDVLIDAARDSLEWLASHNPVLLDAWIELLITSNAPLLRRLAIHAMSINTRKTDDERLEWLLSHTNLDNLAEHHEIHRAVALSYKAASDSSRQVVVSRVLSLKRAATDNWTEADATARAHFDWLSWLLQAKPDCSFAKEALDPVRNQYPTWRLSEHPDLTHWSGPAEWLDDKSPWTVDQLLEIAPVDQLNELLEYKAEGLFGPNRDGLTNAVREACKKNSQWGFLLAEAIIDRKLWKSDLWREIFRGLQEAELDLPGWRKLLEIAANSDLQIQHTRDIADLIYYIVKNGGIPFALDLVEQANAVSSSLWSNLEETAQDEDFDDWLSRAINRPAGVIVEYWIHVLSLQMHGKSADERFLPEQYRQWFTKVIQDQSTNGGLGRSILASQTAFLFGLDSSWTTQYVIPLFSDPNEKKFEQAWDGFLVWGRLYPSLVEVLMPAFAKMFERLKTSGLERRKRFVEFYTALAIFHVPDPTEVLLRPLFQHGTVDDWVGFSNYVEYILRSMQPAAVQEVCDRWLFRYWQSRLEAVPVPLQNAEVRNMLDWLPELGDYFPKGVMLAIRFPAIEIDHSHLLYELKDSDLVVQHPSETARLLIYLCGCTLTYHVGYLKEVASRLPPIDLNLKKSLDEALARKGAI
ncbi:MAG TPA: SIR2 family protein [Noviherbaspirillum sp.]|nr:SIR2 family protein [Noviherbaspirillum sp.]